MSGRALRRGIDSFKTQCATHVLCDGARNRIPRPHQFTVEFAVFLTSQLRVRADANVDLNRTLSDVFERYERQVCDTDRPPTSACVVDTYYEVSTCVCL